MPALPSSWWQVWQGTSRWVLCLKVVWKCRSADFLDVAGVGGALHENEGKGCQKKDDVLHEGSP